GHSSAYLVFELNSTFETAIAVSGIGETGKSGINGPLDIYSISGWNSGGGSITASRTEARPGDTVTLTVQAASGYEYRAWPLKFKVNGVILPLTADGQTYTFTMPASDAAVTVEPGAAPFQSVDPGLTLSTPVSTGGDTLALTEESPGTFVISGYNAGDVVFDMSTVPLAADLTVASAVSGGTETIVMSDYGFTVTLTPQSTPSTAVFTVTVTAQDGLQKTYTVRVE
ncbi:MAG: hypothetical protein LBD48_02295, partial [Treponema sp.]|nr:hypothetical protein [Treponema sp.]